MDTTNRRKVMPVPELLTVWGPAFPGSTLGSIVIGILGMILAIVSYPNVELEHGAAIVGALFGSFFSIPTGVFVGGVVGMFIYNFLSKRNSLHPVFIASAAAFVTGILASGLTLIPVGFVFFGRGHIGTLQRLESGTS